MKRRSRPLIAYRSYALSTTEAMDALLCERVSKHSKATLRAFILFNFRKACNNVKRLRTALTSEPSAAVVADLSSWIKHGNYAASAVSACNFRVSRDFWRFAVPFLMTPLLAARSKRLTVVLHNSCAVSTLRSSSAVSVCLRTVRSVDLRWRLRIRFASSARACFFADRRCKTLTPFENLFPENRGIEYLFQ